MISVRYLSRSEVLRLSASIDVEAALRRVVLQAEAGHAGQSIRSELAPDVLGSVLGVMPGYRAVAPVEFSAKVVCVVPDNPSRGLPAHQGMVMLFDAETGAPKLLADAGAITEIRTAALTVLATRTLGPTREGSSLIIGAGHQALAHARALAVLGRRLAVWARKSERAGELVRTLEAEGVRAEAVTDLEAAIGAASVVTTVTGTPEPIIREEWFQPGTLLNAIGSSTPRVREVPESMIRNSKLVADDPGAVLELSGEFSGLVAPVPRPMSLGAALESDSRPGGAGERTVFKSVGMPLQDLALASALAEESEAGDVGQRIRL